MLQQMLGSLMQKLMQSSSGSGSSAAPATTATTPTTPTGCSSYVPTTDATLVTTVQNGGPCYFYEQPVISPSTVNSTADTLSISPTSGVAPLGVTATFSSGPTCSDAYDLSWGDATPDMTQTYVAPATGASCAASGQLNMPNHTYMNTGTYTATLLSGSNLQFTSTVTITVTDATASATNTTTGTSQLTAQVTSVTTADSSPLIVPQGTIANITPGISGNIQLLDNGGTILGGNVDTTNNTVTAGFYGSDTFGSQPQGVIAGLCQSRPWASSVLSYVLPASFFDGLCAMNGYQVGTPVPVPAPVVTVTQSAPAPVASSTPTTPVSTVTPSVSIWAVPASVPLGSRTSIFWSSQGVTSCLVTSPDGSFSQNSLSGGASTVALTGATTYTMSCLAPDGSHVTGYTTVNLSI
jgi:hypothetical protein